METKRRLLSAGFTALADYLERQDVPTAGFDDNRSVAFTLVDAVNTFAGDKLTRRFETPRDEEDDYTSFLLDFRRERVTVRPQRDDAILLSAGALTDELSRYFLAGPNAPYVELIAMPRSKLTTLYRVRVGIEVIPPEMLNVTALRRQLPPAPEYPDGLILLAVLRGPNDLAEITDRLGAPQVRATVSSSTHSDWAWQHLWADPAAWHPEKLAVLIDGDPFKWVTANCNDRAHTLLKLGFEWGPIERPTRTEVLVIADPTTADRVAFTPCSGIVFDAIASLAHRRHLKLTFGADPDAAVLAVIVPVVKHILNEEREFGFDFWWHDI